MSQLKKFEAATHQGEGRITFFARTIRMTEGRIEAFTDKKCLRRNQIVPILYWHNVKWIRLVTDGQDAEN